MKVSDHNSRLRLEVEHCPMRPGCPLAFMCGVALNDGKPLLPVISDVGYGEMIWTDLNTRHRVCVVRSGLLLNRVYASRDEEIPHSIFGMGFVGGIPDIYIPYVASDFYFFSGLVTGQLCSFDGGFAKERIDALGTPQAQLLIARIGLNHTTSIYSQTLTFAHRRVRDKVVSVLLRVEGELSRQPGFGGELPIAHDDVAFLACIERATASRELKRLAQEGFIDLGYRRIRVLPTLRQAFGDMIEANLPFYDNDLSVLQ